MDVDPLLLWLYYSILYYIMLWYFFSFARPCHPLRALESDSHFKVLINMGDLKKTLVSDTARAKFWRLRERESKLL